MKVAVAGASGFIGRAVMEELRAFGHEAAALKRGPDGYTDLPKTADAVINLAGESIAGYWTAAKKRRILETRVAATRRLVEWMHGLANPPQVFVSASAVGYYGDRPGEVLTEDSGPDPARRFRCRVCLEWEAAALSAPSPTRVVLLRMGDVLDFSGGMLLQLRRAFRLVPFRYAPYELHVPWISLADAARMIVWALETPSVAGPINVVAPVPTNHDAIASFVAGRRPRLRLPEWLVRAALGELSQALFDDQHVVPEKAINAGFFWRHEAVGDLVADR